MKLRKLYILGILLIVLELGLRLIGLGNPPVVILDPEIEYYPEPGGNFNRFGNDIQINRYGMRSPDFDLNAPHQDRIFIFGDSVVYGNHFLDQQDTIAYELQKKLGDSPAEVYAVAASSWGSGNILAYLRRFKPIKGRTAIIVQSTHDRLDVPFASNDIIPYRKRRSLCAIDDMMQIIVERLLRRIDSYADQPRYSAKELRFLTDESLRAVISYARTNFEQVILVHHATAQELRERRLGAQRYYQELAVEESIEFISTIDEYAKHPMSESIHQDTIHLSGNGTEYFAAMLRDRINLTGWPN